MVDIVRAAYNVKASLNPYQFARTMHHIDSPEWRTWSNPEILMCDKGIRLDEVSEDLRNKIMSVLEATLSPEGYQKAVGAMRINHFLGELVNSPKVMNEYSYNFVLFGSEPSLTKPWGFSFYGHHLCLNVFLYKTQMVISPWFVGAEPNFIDEGPYKGTQILHVEETLGLALMQKLPEEKQKQAQIFEMMNDPKMPKGRWNHDDQRHMCGAYRDNRTVPYEGVLVSDMTEEQRLIVTDIMYQYLLFLPRTALGVRLKTVQEWYHETYFSWIGPYKEAGAAFYFRLQSPVILVEFDHHSGVFLNNSEPLRFHTHTLMRTPNGGDYGTALKQLIPGKDQDFLWEE